MSRLAVTIVFLASLAIGGSLWLIADRLFARTGNGLLSRFDKTDAVEASVVAAQGGFLQSKLMPLRAKVARWFMGNGLSKAAQVQLFELPDLVDLLAVALSSGEGLYSALVRVSDKANGVVADELKRVVLAVQLGSNLPVELSAMSARCGSRHVAELCTKLQLALVRGTPLAEMLADQAQSLRDEVHQVLNKKSGQNETRMLVPLIFLILPITVIFAVYPSLQIIAFTQ